MQKSFELVLRQALPSYWAWTHQGPAVVCCDVAALLFKPKGTIALATVSQPPVDGELQFSIDVDGCLAEVLGKKFEYDWHLESILARHFDLNEPMSVKWEDE